MRKPIPGFDGYEVDDQGGIWSEWGGGWKPRRTGSFRLLSSPIDSTGYPRTGLTRQGISVNVRNHRVVLEAFVGPCPPGMEACHNDGNRANNRLDNLRWDTPKNNQKDRIRHGTSMRGEYCPSSRLSAEKVLEIRERLASGVSCYRIAKDLGMAERTIYRIRNRESWQNVRGEVFLNQWQAFVKKSHFVFGHLVNDAPTVIPDDRAAMHVSLVNEEAGELAEAVAEKDIPEIADACVDLIYVTCSLATAYGINLQPIFEEVHRTNMLKAGGGKRADGKQQKPPNWQPPRVAELLTHQGWDGH